MGSGYCRAEDPKSTERNLHVRCAFSRRRCQYFWSGAIIGRVSSGSGVACCCSHNHGEGCLCVHPVAYYCLDCRHDEFRPGYAEYGRSRISCGSHYRCHVTVRRVRDVSDVRIADRDSDATDVKCSCSAGRFAGGDGSGVVHKPTHVRNPGDPVCFTIVYHAAESASLLVYGPGKYRFVDFVRAGSPLTVITLIILVTVVPVLWPL